MCVVAWPLAWRLAVIDGLMRDQDTAIFKPFLARPSPSGGRPPRTIARCRDDGLCTPNTGDGRRKIYLTSVASFCICLADGTARQPVDILFTGARVGGRRAGQCPATIRRTVASVRCRSAAWVTCCQSSAGSRPQVVHAVATGTTPTATASSALICVVSSAMPLVSPDDLPSRAS